MIIYKTLTLAAGANPDDNGEIEIRISHNGKLGVVEDSEKAWDLILQAVLHKATSLTVVEW